MMDFLGEKTETPSEALIAQAFRRFDVDGDGIITRQELTTVLQSLSPGTWTDERVELLMRTVDVNGDGRIQYNEFVSWVMGHMAAWQLSKDMSEPTSPSSPMQVHSVSNTAAALAAAFQRFDRNGDGYISCSELSVVLCNLAPCDWTEEKVRELLQAADWNRDGRIQYNEFAAWVAGRKAAQHLAGALASAPAAAKHGETEARIVEAFQRFDTNRDGVISRSELFDVMQQLNPGMWTDEKVDLLLERADMNRDGRIQYSEFVAWAMAKANPWHSRDVVNRMAGVAEISDDDEPEMPTSPTLRPLTFSIIGMNGHTLTSVTLSPEDTVATLRSVASAVLGGQPCKLVVGASFLANHMTLLEAGLHDGIAVTAVVTCGVLQMASTAMGGYAVLKADGSVVTWGATDVGGDSSAVAETLRGGVKHIFANWGAFAALKTNGAVVAWGAERCGGRLGLANEQLQDGVVQIAASGEAFSGLKLDGSVVCWGNISQGSAAEHLRSGVKRILANKRAFAALRTDGSLVAWCDGAYGGDLGAGPASRVAERLGAGFTHLWCTNSAFAALRPNGCVVAWGHSLCGGDAGAAAEQLTDGVERVVGNDVSFAALKTSGTVVTWGHAAGGGDSQQVQEQLRGSMGSATKEITPSGEAFAALREDGTVVTWGACECSAEALEQLAVGSIISVVATRAAFAALRRDGSVVAWGNPDAGGQSSAVGELLQGGVVRVVAGESAFVALKQDGSVVTWGASEYGGSPGAAAEHLREGVTQVLSAGRAFAAVKADSSVVVWGSSVEAAAIAKLQPLYSPVAAG